MLHAVVSLEFLLGSRRGRLAALRRVYAAWLAVQLAGLTLLYLVKSTDPAVSFHDWSFVSFYLQVFLVQHFLLLIVATPVFVAGTVADEKAHGTLAALLTTRLGSPAIVAGKLLGRLAQVGLVALMGLPVIAFVGGCGHLDGAALLGLVAVSMALAFGLGSASLLASVWSGQMRDAMFRVAAGAAIAVAAAVAAVELGIPALAAGLPAGSPWGPRLARAEAVLRCADPLHVLEPVWVGNASGDFGARLQAAAGLYGGVGLACLALAAWRLRPAYRRQLARLGRARPRWWRFRRPVSDDPVRWRQLAVEHRLPPALVAAAVFAASAASSFLIHDQLEPWYYPVQGVAVLLLASLAVGVRASRAITGERERQTWESLLLTPLETWELVGDKVDGILYAVLAYVAAYALPALYWAVQDGVGYAIMTAALLVPTAAGMYFMGATGIRCSARAESSWRSLLATLASGYGHVFALTFFMAAVYLALSCVVAPVAAALLMAFGVADPIHWLTVVLVVAAAGVVTQFLRRAAWKKVDDAEHWIDDGERCGATFARALSRALRKHQQRQDQAKAVAAGAEQTGP